MRVLVCGGRDFHDKEFLFRTLDRFHNQYHFEVVIQGEAKGADLLAKEWAESRLVSCWCFPADWAKHGKRAGYLRNIEMLEKGQPDLVIAFPGGRGTDHMKSIARKAGVSVIEFINGQSTIDAFF